MPSCRPREPPSLLAGPVQVTGLPNDMGDPSGLILRVTPVGREPRSTALWVTVRRLPRPREILTKDTVRPKRHGR